MMNDVLTESDRVRRLFRERFTFQISLDTPHVSQGLAVAEAALAAGVTILELGTPLLKYEGVRNVAPIFRQRFPKALLLADMKTMDGGEGEATAVLAAAPTSSTFLRWRARRRPKPCALRAMRSVRLIRRSRGSPSLTCFCPCRDRQGRRLRRRSACSTPAWMALAFTFNTTPDGPIPPCFRAAICMTWRPRFSTAWAQAHPCRWWAASAPRRLRALARKGLRAFVISGNLGVADAKSRYGLPGAEIERHIRDFIGQVSAAG